MALRDSAMEEAPQQHSLLQCHDLRFKCLTFQPSFKSFNRDQLRSELLRVLSENNMVAYYKTCLEDGLVPDDEALLAKMNEVNKAKLEKFTEDMKEAEESAGDSDKRDLLEKKAQFVELHARPEDAVAQYEEVLKLKCSKGQRIDVSLAVLTIALAWDKEEIWEKWWNKTDTMVEEQGDWDRRNNFLILSALWYIRERKFVKATENLLKNVTTYLSEHTTSYRTFVQYTICSSLITLDRVKLKKQLVDSPHVKEALLENDQGQLFQQLLDAHYGCRYKEYFIKLAQIMEFLRMDPFFSANANYFLREARLCAYQQFLKSYISITLQAMADAFGVSVEFIDKELWQFSATNRITAKIDKIRGVIEASNLNKKNTDYQAVILRGDALLHKIEKLSKWIDA